MSKIPDSVGFSSGKGATIKTIHPAGPVFGARRIDHFGRVYVQTEVGRIYEGNPDKRYQRIVTAMKVCLTLSELLSKKGYKGLDENQRECLNNKVKTTMAYALVSYFLSKAEDDCLYCEMVRELSQVTAHPTSVMEYLESTVAEIVNLIKKQKS